MALLYASSNASDNTMRGIIMLTPRCVVCAALHFFSVPLTAVPMNLMSNESITWTVERERGISFDLTTLCDVEWKPADASDIKREIKLEVESGVKDTTFGHPFGHRRPVPPPRPRSPSPFSRTPMWRPKREILPTWEEKHPVLCISNTSTPQPPSAPDAPTTIGRTRSHGTRPSKPGGASSIGRTVAPASFRVKGDRPEPRSHRRRAGGVDMAALTAELGLVSSRHRRAKRNNGDVHRVGAYTLEERAALVAKFHSKRGRRIWRKKIKYDCRKKLADKRPRLKGRFVTQEELDGLDQETLAKVTGLGPFEAESSESDVDDDSDSSEGCGRTTTATSLHQGKGRFRGDGKRELKVKPSVAQPPLARPNLKAKKSSAGGRRVGKEAKNAARPAGVIPDPSHEHEMLDSVDWRSEFGSSEVSAMFNIKVDPEAEIQRGEQGDQGGDNQSEIEDDDAIKVQSCETADLMSEFIVDDIMSSNFNIVPNRDIEAMSAGVTVS